jgi:Mn-dependent DtxR family transcriptional regulator
MVRSIDLARHMGFSKPSISHAVGVLRDGGFLTMDEDGFLHLTDIGREVAEKIYERHQFFTEQLVAAGVDRETAEQDACLYGAACGCWRRQRNGGAGRLPDRTCNQ